jgi:membrane protein
MGKDMYAPLPHTSTRIASQLARAYHAIAEILHRAARGFVADRCLIGASALSYATILALLPLTVIVLVIFSSFPLFAVARAHFLELILRVFAPEVGGTAAQWLEFTATNAAQTTLFGIAAFAVTVLLLLAGIEEQLNVIWHVAAPRRWAQRILIYWMLLTLGPALLGAALSLPSYISGIASFANAQGIVSQLAVDRSFARLLPFCLETGCFLLLDWLMPNRRMRVRESLIGALVASLLLEVLKLFFALYIARFSSYNAVYGTIAGIPILLLWMYIFWSVVLFGAEIAAAISVRREERLPALPRGTQEMTLALALLAELEHRRQRGGALSTGELGARLGVEPATVEPILAPLRRSGFVAATAEGDWVLARALASASLQEIEQLLRLSLLGMGREESP